SRRIAPISHTSCCAASRPVVSVSRNTIFCVIGVLLCSGPPQGGAFGVGGRRGWYRAVPLSEERPVPAVSHGGRPRRGGGAPRRGRSAPRTRGSLAMRLLRGTRRGGCPAR